MKIARKFFLQPMERGGAMGVKYSRDMLQILVLCVVYSNSNVSSFIHELTKSLSKYLLATSKVLVS